MKNIFFFLEDDAKIIRGVVVTAAIVLFFGWLVFKSGVVVFN